MASFAKYVGGCPTNISIGTARLGLKSALVTGVGDEHMGRFIREQLVHEGVDVSHVKTDPERLTALVILGIRDEDTFPLVFFRENCADMAIEADDIDEEFVTSAKAVLVSGTHFTAPRVDAASRHAMRLARKNGVKVAFDIDYRPVLWGLTGHGLGEERFIENDDVTRHLQSILPGCDLVVGTEEELHIAGGTTDTLAAIRKVREHTDALIVCKRGPMGCVAFPGDIPVSIEDGIRGPGFPVEVYNVLGAGDAFMSGFLRGWLRDEPVEECCRLANACGAFAVSRHGCAPAIPSWTELETFLAEGSPCFALRKDERISHIHRATTRKRDWPEVLAFAFDHRSQFEEWAGSGDGSAARISTFKQICLEALREVRSEEPSAALLVDDRLGRTALHAAADDGCWIGRPIELPGSVPIEFEIGPDLGSRLAEWPVDHVVKCLIFYHPDDDESLRLLQEERVLRLQDACINTGHELLLEIIAGKSGPVDAETIARAVRRFYEIGVRPDWWKLEPPVSVAQWRNTVAAIEENDPFCRGILVLGLDAPIDELAEGLALAASEPACKGFAVGRTIFGQAAEDWFAGRIDDAEARRRIAANHRALIGAWRQARPAPETK
jgi:5-dehydro-2-deoxygluconokinase